MMWIKSRLPEIGIIIPASLWLWLIVHQATSASIILGQLLTIGFLGWGLCAMRRLWAREGGLATRIAMGVALAAGVAGLALYMAAAELLDAWISGTR